MPFRQRMRAKHQVLILKCYPKLPKNPAAAEIKPNGSELSYLMYYASSRQSKLSKIGAFLEKKVSHDLYKLRTAAVQVSLQILTAFLENPAIGAGTGAPQGFGLFAPHVLRILDEVLREANEAVLIDTLVPTWDSFCKHQDHVTLSADAQYGALYARVVGQLAAYASQHATPAGRVAAEKRGKMRVGATDRVTLRMAGLRAIKSMIESDSLGTEAGRQLSTILPVLLKSIYDGDADLANILQLNDQFERQEKERMTRSRPSVMSIHDTSQNDRDPREAVTTVDEADRLADQQASLLALRCLRSVFTFENRAQIRGATNVVLNFIISHRPVKGKAAPTSQEGLDGERHWTVTLFKTITRWTPVQDRFVAVFTAVEMLIKTSTSDDDLRAQLFLTRIVAALLSSEINLIGLSVMDVLLALLQHMLRQLPPASFSSSSSSSSAAADGAAATEERSGLYPTDQATGNGGPRESPLRTHVLSQLQQCITNLAVHVYYTDQISDMVLAIVMRLKPTSLTAAAGSHLQVPPAARPSSNTPSAAVSAAGDTDSASFSDAGANSTTSPRNSTRTLPSGFFFSTPTAREMALNAVGDIILCTDQNPHQVSYMATNRNPVPLQVWEGTQWLLRDPSPEVRDAYIRAFRAWISNEMPRLNLASSLFPSTAAGDIAAAIDRPTRKSLSKELARRAASNASTRKAAGLRVQSSVLQSIHLAVVEALQQQQQQDPSSTQHQSVGSSGVGSFRIGSSRVGSSSAGPSSVVGSSSIGSSNAAAAPTVSSNTSLYTTARGNILRLPSPGPLSRTDRGPQSTSRSSSPSGQTRLPTMHQPGTHQSTTTQPETPQASTHQLETRQSTTTQPETRQSTTSQPSWDTSSTLGALEAALADLSAGLNLPSLDKFRTSQAVLIANTPRNFSNSIYHRSPSPQDDPRRPSLAQSIGRSAAMANAAAALAAQNTGGSDRTDFAGMPLSSGNGGGELPASSSVSDLKRLLNQGESSRNAGPNAQLQSWRSTSAMRSVSKSPSGRLAAADAGAAGYDSRNGDHIDRARHEDDRNSSTTSSVDHHHDPHHHHYGSSSSTITQQHRNQHQSWPLRDDFDVTAIDGQQQQQQQGVVGRNNISSSNDNHNNNNNNEDAESLVEYGGSWISFDGDEQEHLSQSHHPTPTTTTGKHTATNHASSYNNTMDNSTIDNNTNHVSSQYNLSNNYNHHHTTNSSISNSFSYSYNGGGGGSLAMGRDNSTLRSTTIARPNVDIMGLLSEMGVKEEDEQQQQQQQRQQRGEDGVGGVAGDGRAVEAKAGNTTTAAAAAAVAVAMRTRVGEGSRGLGRAPT